MEGVTTNTGAVELTAQGGASSKSHPGIRGTTADEIVAEDPYYGEGQSSGYTERAKQLAGGESNCGPACVMLIFWDLLVLFTVFSTPPIFTVTLGQALYRYDWYIWPVVITVFLILWVSALLWFGCRCCQCFKCCKNRFCCKPNTFVRWARRSWFRVLVAACVLSGALLTAFVIYIQLPGNKDTGSVVTSVDGQPIDPSLRIAIIGSGASGLSAAWTLTQSGYENVDIFEAADVIGGHSRTVNYTTPAYPGGEVFDIGFIFTIGKNYWVNLTREYGVDLIPSCLTTSSNVNGLLWDNTNRWRDTKWTSEIDRYQSYVDEYDTDQKYNYSPITLLCPYWIWMWLHGFSTSFFAEIIEPLYSLLFVTKTGLGQQGAEVSMSYLQPLGYTQFNSQQCDTITRIYKTEGGSTPVWQQVADDIGMEKIYLNTPMTKARRVKDDKWEVTLGGTGPLAGSTRTYDKLVFSPDADMALELIEDIPWMLRALLKEFEWTSSYLTLHNNSAFIVGHPDDTVYHWQDVPLGSSLSGWIGKDFGYNESNLVTTVHFEEGLKDIIGRENVLESHYWKHPITTMWHAIINNWWMPKFNHQHNLHFVGSHIDGIGHNSAISSGMSAACKIGVANAPPSKATRFIQHTCDYT